MVHIHIYILPSVVDRLQISVNIKKYHIPWNVHASKLGHHLWLKDSEEQVIAHCFVVVLSSNKL